MKTRPKGFYSTASIAEIAAFSMWVFSVQNRNVPNISGMVNVGEAGMECARFIRTSNVSGSGPIIDYPITRTRCPLNVLLPECGN